MLGAAYSEIIHPTTQASVTSSVTSTARPIHALWTTEQLEMMGPNSVLNLFPNLKSPLLHGPPLSNLTTTIAVTWSIDNIMQACPKPSVLLLVAEGPATEHPRRGAAKMIDGTASPQSYRKVRAVRLRQNGLEIVTSVESAGEKVDLLPTSGGRTPGKRCSD
jgi:hypothetical protein